MSNRAQRRAIAKLSKARKPGQSFAEAIGAKKMVEEAVRRQVHDNDVKMEMVICNQYFIWEAIIALRDAFGFSGIRAKRFLDALEKVIHEIEEMSIAHGKPYAFEKLRQEVSKILGEEVRPVFEQEMMEARRENEAKGIFFPADPDL